MDSTPKSLGFRMPAEWEPQEAIWLSWPHNEVTWPKMVPEIEEIYVQFIKALHSGQKANLLVNDKEREDYVKNKLAKSKINLSQISCVLVIYNICNRNIIMISSVRQSCKVVEKS